MARNYVRGSGKTGRLNRTKNAVTINMNDREIIIQKEQDTAKYYMGHRVTVVPENRSGLTGRHNERRVTARPAERPWVDIENLADPTTWANNAEPLRESAIEDVFAAACEDGSWDCSVSAEAEPYHV